jgi:hypothetical protein
MNLHLTRAQALAMFAAIAVALVVSEAGRVVGRVV